MTTDLFRRDERPTRERRFTGLRPGPVQMESRGSDPPQIVGMAAVYYDGTRDTEYQLWDDLVERLAPGCFERAVKDGADVCALYNHNPDYLLGRVRAQTLKLELDPKGLRYRIDPPDTQCGRDVVTSIKRGDLMGSSFSFAATKVEWQAGQDGGPSVRLVREVELYDVSPVTNPAYSGTSVGMGEQAGGGHTQEPNIDGSPAPGKKVQEIKPGTNSARCCRAIGDLAVLRAQWSAWQAAESARRARIADILTRARIVEMESL